MNQNYISNGFRTGILILVILAIIGLFCGCATTPSHYLEKNPSTWSVENVNEYFFNGPDEIDSDIKSNLFITTMIFEFKAISEGDLSPNTEIKVRYGLRQRNLYATTIASPLLPDKAVIGYNEDLLSMLGEDELNDTVAHEIAHLIVGIEEGENEHGPKWRAACKKLLGRKCDDR